MAIYEHNGIKVELNGVKIIAIYEPTEIPFERCSRCKHDINKSKHEGGCICDSSHIGDIHGSRITGVSEWNYYEGVYDGWGWYDMAQYKMDRME